MHGIIKEKNLIEYLSFLIEKLLHKAGSHQFSQKI